MPNPYITTAPAPTAPMTNLIAPDLIAQQLQVQRQQQFASLLQQQGMAPAPDTQVIGGWAVKQKPITYLAKLGQVLAGGYLQNQALDKQADISTQMAQKQLDMMKQLYGGQGTGSGGMPSGISSENVGDPSAASPPSSVDPRRQAAMAAALMGNNQLASNLMENVLNKTDFAKDAAGLPTNQMTAAYQNKLLSAPTAQALAAGIDPAQANAGALAKANYIAPVDAKPGTPVLDPITHQLIAFAPKVGEGIDLKFGTNNGVTSASGANPIPGYAGANAGIQGAEQGAKQANTIFTGVQNPFGGTSAGYGGTLLGGSAPTAAPVPSMGLGTPQKNQANPAPRGVVSSPSATDAAIQKQSADEFAQLPQIVQQAKGSISGLEAALRQSNLVNATGTGTAKTNDIISGFNNATGANIKGDSNTSYQLLNKYLANSLQQAAQGTGATGSDARMEGFSAGQPNADHMSVPALQGAIRYVLGQNDAGAAGAQFKQDAYAKEVANGNPNAAQAAKAQWSQVYKPDNFNFNRMNPTEQAAFLKSQGSNAPSWVAQYNQYAQDHPGWVR